MSQVPWWVKDDEGIPHRVHMHTWIRCCRRRKDGKELVHWKCLKCKSSTHNSFHDDGYPTKELIESQGIEEDCSKVIIECIHNS
jgi:hypothetical protein